MSNEQMFTIILERMDTMETGFNGLNTKVDKLDDKVSKLDDKVDKLDDKVSKLDDKVNKLDDKVDKLDDKVNKLDDKVNELDDKVNELDDKVIKLDYKVDKLESSMNMEFWAVRTEMGFVQKSLKKEIDTVNDKLDRFWVTKDVEGHDKLKVRVDVLEKGYQELKEKIV